jgi:ATP-dependent protease ClpP protease subunit
MSEEQVIENKEEEEETIKSDPIIYIDVFGTVSEESVKNVFLAFTKGSPEIKIGGHVQINVSTPGGISRSGANLLEIINTKQDLNGTVVCVGLCASAGFALLGTKLTTLCYASTVFMNHGATYQYKEENKDYILEHIIVEERLVSSVDAILIEKAGINEKEYLANFTGVGAYNLGYDVLWMGNHGLVDGIIVKDLPGYGWIILTREGYKQWDSGFKGHIRDQPLLADESCERFGLKQHVPSKPKFKKDKTLNIPKPTLSNK